MATFVCRDCGQRYTYTFRPVAQVEHNCPVTKMKRYLSPEPERKRAP